MTDVSSGKGDQKSFLKKELWNMGKNYISKKEGVVI
jgi:hypothetical protein